MKLGNTEPIPVNLTDAELEQQLAELSRGSIPFYIVAAVAAVGMIAGVLSQLMFIAVPAFIALAVAVIFISLKSGRKKALVSANVTRSVLGEVFGQIEEYLPDGFVSEAIVQNADILPHWDRIGGSDYVRARYHGTELYFSDLRLAEIETHTDSDGHITTSEETVFKGQWISVRLSKTLEHRLRLFEKKGILGQKSNIETENEQFNKKYRILADDGHTAFYILTPHFMDYICTADNAADGRTRFCFDGDRVHIAVENKNNLFEVGGGYRNIAALRERMRAEAGYITGIIDELLQNTYLFGGES